MTSTEPSSLIPVTLLTGFLGSGKTTVLNHVLKQPEMAATAVIVNEFGEIGLDHLLVERSSEDVVLLNSGCVCCTGARRHRRHLDQSACRSSEGQSSVLHPRRD